MKKLILLFICFLLLGCVTRTVYVPHGQAVRLRQDVKDAKVWVKTEEGETVKGKMDIYDGWYCLPLDDDEKED